jgi:ERCC4-type nuclease
LDLIFVDRRIGSEDLLLPLQKRGLPATFTELKAGDIAFEGKGAENTTLDIGIELKRLDSGDLLQSLRSGRLAGEQLPKLLGASGAYSHAWLVVEGQWRTDDSGHVVVYQGPKRGWKPLRGRLTAAELTKSLLTLEVCGGLHVRYTNSRTDTLQFIDMLYRWFTDKAIDKHTSHLAVHDTATFMPTSDFRRTVMAFPGIGLRVSADVEKCFKGSLIRAINAPASLWAEIGSTKRLGIKTAEKIVRFLNGV